MKRVVALIIACAMSLALFGCGKKDTGKSNDEQNQTKDTEAVVDDKPAADAGVTVSQKDGNVIFVVDPVFNLSEYAWLGFCPGSKGYTNEADADGAQVLYSYIVNDGGYKAGDDYLFSVSEDQISGLGDGDFTIVLCDDDNDGKVVLYFPAVIKDGKATFDLDKVVINK